MPIGYKTCSYPKRIWVFILSFSEFCYALSNKNFDSKTNSYENVLSYPLKEAREKFEKDYLTSQLKKHKGNISKTAEFIGMERSALHRKLRTLGIKGVN